MTDDVGTDVAGDPFQGLDFRQVVELLEALDPGMPLATMDIGALFERFPELADVEVRDVTIESPHGPVGGRIYRASDSERAGFVWVHGGGFIVGDVEMPEAHWVSLALAARGIPVLSLDYHKALRGVHYPVPSDDVLAGWTWATTHADQLGVTAADLHFGGASAGANLVAGVTKRLRDSASPLPASLVLAYPLLHGDIPPLSRELQEKLAAEEVESLSAASVREMNMQYVGSEALLDDRYAFAANGDVSGQPPVFILNSDTDVLRASGEAYAEQLGLAGVDVTIETEPGTRHGHLNGPDEPGAFPSLDRIATWLQAHDGRADA
jgi:acetyl esterase